jgi:hypothetical protein
LKASLPSNCIAPRFTICSNSTSRSADRAKPVDLSRSPGTASGAHFPLCEFFRNRRTFCERNVNAVLHSRKSIQNRSDSNGSFQEPEETSTTTTKVNPRCPLRWDWKPRMTPANNCNAVDPDLFGTRWRGKQIQELNP